VLDIESDTILNANVLATAFAAAAINLVPEPFSISFVAITLCAIGGAGSRRLRA
jgi:hypothetical protein